MNIKLRFKNKPVLLAIVLAAVAFVYQICGIVGVVPPISEEDVVQWIGLLFNILVGLGVLVDPTTSGVGDSARAMDYETPNKDKGQDNEQGYLEDGDNGDIIESEHEEEVL